MVVEPCRGVGFILGKWIAAEEGEGKYPSFHIAGNGEDVLPEISSRLCFRGGGPLAASGESVSAPDPAHWPVANVKPEILYVFPGCW